MCPFLSQDQLNTWKIILSPLATLLATFLGALFAFMLQNKREKDKELNNNVAALNKVQINLVQQLNALTIFNKDFIQPYKDHPLNWVAVPAAPHRNYSHLKIDGGSLSFLIEKDSSFLISKILVTEEHFQEVMNLINIRSEAHVGKLQKKLEQIGFKEGEPFEKSLEDVENFLGVCLVGEMKRLTTGLISTTENAIKAHEEMIKEIKAIGTKIFPKKRVLSFQYQQTEEENTPYGVRS